MKKLFSAVIAVTLFGVVGISLADEADVTTNAPTPQEIVYTLVQQAAELRAENGLRGEDPSQTAILFVTEVLHELGLHAPQTEDTYTFSASCDPAAKGWTCRVVLGISWSDAESAMIAEFGLEERAEGADCVPHRFDTSPAFSICKWRVQDDRIKVYVVG